MGLSRTIRSIVWRVLASGLLSAGLTGLASLGMLLTTEGRIVNLLLEPFSLLFLPGIVVAMAWTVLRGHLHPHPKTFSDNHDFSATLVMQCTFWVYFSVLYWLASRRSRRAVDPAEAAWR